MAITDTSITSVQLTNTFEDWRIKTNQVITVINENDDDNPVTAILSANSTGGLQINTITTNVITGSNVTGSKLLFSGGNVDFTSANVVSGGNVHQIFILGSATGSVSGTNPESSIANVQINGCEINLNGKTLRANGSSQVIFTGATITDLGTINLVNIQGGQIVNTNFTISSSEQGTISVTSGTHEFSGATMNGGSYTNASIANTVIHSGNVSINTNSYLVTNTGAVLASDVGDANVAIGSFAEWTTQGRKATSSVGRLHVRTDFAAPSTTKTSAVSGGTELVLEGNTAVGMTFLSNNAANTTLFFGDEDDADAGYFRYDHAQNEITIALDDSAEKARIYHDYGGSLQIAGANTFETLAAKLHINQASTDDIDALYINSDDADTRAILIDGEQTTSNVVELDVDAITTGSAISVHMGLGTSVSQAFGGSLLSLTDNNSSTTGRTIFKLIQDHVDATAANAFSIQSDGGSSLVIDNNTATKHALYIDDESTTGKSVEILSDALTTGQALKVSSTAAHSQNLVQLVTDSSSATGTTLGIQTDGGRSLVIDNNSGTYSALEIDDETTTGTGVTITHDVLSSGVGTKISSTAEHSGSLFQIISDGAATGSTLYVRSDATTSTVTAVNFANSTSSMFSVDAGGNVGINDDSPDYKLDVNGTGRFTDYLITNTVVAEDASDSKRIMFPDGAAYKGSASSTGYLRFRLPASSASSASMITIDGYVYIYGDGTGSTYSYESFRWFASGYVQSNTWYNVSANIIGDPNDTNDYNILFCNDGTYGWILIERDGDGSGTVWKYTQAGINIITVGHNGSTNVLWHKGYDVDISTTLPTLKATVATKTRTSIKNSSGTVIGHV